MIRYVLLVGGLRDGGGGCGACSSFGLLVSPDADTADVDNTSRLPALLSSPTLPSTTQPKKKPKPKPKPKPKVIDLSSAAAVMDMRPSRLSIMTGAAKAFIRAFFDQNPLSQLGVVVMREGVAQRLTELSGSPESQIAQLGAAMATGGWGGVQRGGGAGGPVAKGLVVGD